MTQADVAAPRRNPVLSYVNRLSYGKVFRAEPIERIGMIKHGLRASDAKRILSDLAMTQVVAMRALNISAATIAARKLRLRTYGPRLSGRP